eukprot:28413_1
MDDPVFKDTHSCQQNDIFQCSSAKRIKIILNIFNKNITTINEIVSNDYTNAHLLNDFHHIKHYHGDNDYNFYELYKYYTHDIHIKHICKIDKCKHIDRYYRDRSKLPNQYIYNNHDQFKEG